MEAGDRLSGAATVLLVGPPGSGKSTVGEAVAALPELVHVSAGAVFRSLDEHTPRGRRALSYLERGELVPDELAVQLTVEHLRARIVLGAVVPERDLIVMDGIPRTKAQAKLLAPFFEPRRVIQLQASRERLAARTRARGRGDDRDEIFEARLRRYEELTLPLLDEWQARTRTVDAAQSPPAVLRDVLEHIAPVFDAWRREREAT